MSNKTYRDLDVWQAGMDVVEKIYGTTKLFPPDERFGLTAQLRRAAVSIPLNIAEGASRRNTRIFANHISIALGSHAEVETCLEIAVRLGFTSQTEAETVIPSVDRVGQLLNGLLRSLTRSQ